MGTASPTEMLAVMGTSTTPLFGVYSSSSASALYIDAEGNVGIGTASTYYDPETPINTAKLYVKSDIITDQWMPDFVFQKTTNDAIGANLTLSKIRGANVIQADDTIGQIQFGAFDGSEYLHSAVIKAISDGTVATSDIGMHLIFGTSPNYAAAAFERMRITSAGNVGIGTTTPTGNLTLQQINNGDTMFLGVRKTDTAPSGDFIKYQSVSGTDLFRVDNSGNVYQGGIVSSGSLTVTSSSTPQFRAQYDSSNEMTITVSSGGTTTIAVNAPSSPSLFFTPQSNSTNTFSFTDASENSILSIDTSSGYVGIGTTSPGAKLDVNGGLLVGSDANFIDFPNAQAVISQANTGFTPAWPVNSALVVEALATAGGNSAAGLYAVGVSASNRGGYGVEAFGVAGNTADIYDVDGIRAYSVSTHAGGDNIGVWGYAANGANNYSFYGEGGTLYNAGNVGIGTTSPSVNLEVYNESGVGQIRINSPTNSWFSLLAFMEGAIRQSDIIQFNSNYGTTEIEPSNSLHIRNRTATGDIRIFNFTNGDSRNGLTVSANNNVGIGTSSPAYGLEVMASSTAGYFGISSSTQGDVFMIDANGNVGIGTTSPNNLIQVANLINFDDSKSGTFIGYQSGYSNTGSVNSFFGYQAGVSNTSAQGNSFLGTQAGYSNTTGNYNTFVGYGAGYDNSTGTNNSFVGVVTGRYNTTGSYNSFMGSRAGYEVITGSNNLLFGWQAGDNLTTGSNNIVVGYDIDTPAVDTSNFLSIGNLIFATGINGTGTAISSGNVGIGTTSPLALLEVFSDNSSATGLFRVATGTTEGLYIDNSGNVGIGTTELSGAKLHVRVNDVNANGLRMQNDDALGTFKYGTLAMMGQTAYSIPDWPNALLLESDAIGGLVLGSLNADMKFQVGRVTKMVLDFSGNVGIGTSSPAYGLELMASTTNGYFGVSSSTQGDVFMIDANGNVGIGTTTPGQKLTVQGNISLTGNLLPLNTSQSVGSAGVRIYNGWFENLDVVNMTIASSSISGTVSQSFTINSDNVAMDDTEDSSMVFARGSAPSALLTWNSASDRFEFNFPTYVDTSASSYFGGNVGIGTTSPGSFLHVFSSISSAPAINIETSVLDGYPMYKLANGSKRWIFIINGPEYNGTLSDDALQFRSGNTDGTNQLYAMTLQIGGNVGIGTTSPAYGLELMASSTDGYFGISSSTQGDVMMIDANGNVGIGTTSPGANLHINNAGISSVRIESTNAGKWSQLGMYAGATKWQFISYGEGTSRAGDLTIYDEAAGEHRLLIDGPTGNVGIGTTSPAALLDIYQATDTASIANFQNATGSALYIGEDGNVGIGTTSPGTKLEIGTEATGPAATYPGSIRINDYRIGGPNVNGGLEFSGGDGYGGKVYYNYNGDYFGIATRYGSATWSDRLVIKSISPYNVGIGTTSPAYGLELMVSSTNGYFGVSSSTQGDVFVIDANGNVGIGAVTPTYKLQVLSTGQMGLRIATAGSTVGAPAIDISDSSTNVEGLITTADKDSGGTAGLYISTYTNHPLMFGAGYRSGTGGAQMTIDTSGNVGIGTTSPATILHSYLGASGGTPYNAGVTGLTIEGSSHAALQFLTPVANEQYIFFGAPHASGATGARGYIMYGHATDQFYFFTSGNYSFGGGNVGIGTSTPTAGYQLDVWDAAVQGYGAYNNRASHSSLKDVIGDISVLGKIDQLNLKEWQYKSEIASSTGDYTLHFSPFADNFYQVFGLNASEWSIRDADVAGIALKGVQEIGQIIDLKSATTTFPTMTITGLGSVGIGTTSPEYKLEVVGDIAAQSFVNISTAGAKKDISFLTQEEEEEILQQIASTSIATYLYNNEEDIIATKHLGLIAEESPKEILSISGKGIDLYKMASFLFAGMKAQGREIDKLAAEVEAIKLQLNSLGQIGPEPTDSSTLIEKVKQVLLSLGLWVENGIVRMKELFADKITTKEIQIVDKSTGEVYCTWLENGEWMKTKGECGQPQTELAPAPVPEPQPASEPASAPEPVPVPEPTPEPTPEPAPAAAAEPIPTP